MPYTLILFVSRKPNLSLLEFKHHWENVHIPLLKTLVGMDFPLSHTRHYIEREADIGHAWGNEGVRDNAQTNVNDHGQSPGIFGTGFGAGCGFDALAVLTFMDKLHWERFWEKVQREGAQSALRRDEEEWLERKSVGGVFVGDSKSTGRDGGLSGGGSLGAFRVVRELGVEIW
ncbi:hypothetical protein BCR34DRAFT_140116 [Clohesyomyces aquaticus]|uniref:EthD domain-containing protein n=1 Tax=Clohesyomyces aquaticus TaxID=1231657 RepID=A0A1Y1YMH5_9PLEO|nr:hypothetical protein BCR34DRAFT_140116 [Clohesyomyces aquaticus]